jgi:hypothetical protein
MMAVGVETLKQKVWTNKMRILKQKSRTGADPTKKNKSLFLVGEISKAIVFKNLFLLLFFGHGKYVK